MTEAEQVAVYNQQVAEFWIATGIFVWFLFAFVSFLMRVNDNNEGADTALASSIFWPIVFVGLVIRGAWKSFIKYFKSWG